MISNIKSVSAKKSVGDLKALWMVLIYDKFKNLKIKQLPVINGQVKHTMGR